MADINELVTAKFKYGNDEFDPNKIAKIGHENARGWAQHNGYGQEVVDAIQELMGRIQSGDVDYLDYSGNVHSKTNFTNNSKLKHLINFPNGKGIIRTGKTLDTHGIAALYLNELMASIDNTKKEEENKPKDKFTNAGLELAWFNKYFGGNQATPENIEAAWSNLDAKNETTGKRSRTNRLAKYAELLDEYANSDSLNNYDYTGSAYKDAEGYRERLRAAANAARAASNGGDYNAFISAFTAAGGVGADVMFAEGDLKPAEPVEKSEVDLAWEEELKNIPSGVSAEEIAKRKEQFYNDWDQEHFKSYYDRKYDEEYNDWANEHYKGNGLTTIISLGKKPWTEEEKLLWIGSGKDTDEDETRYGYFSNDHHVKYAQKLLYDLIKGKNISGTSPKYGYNNYDILRAFMYRLKLKNLLEDDDFTKIDDNHYFINSSFDIDTGTGIRYNYKNRSFERIYVNPKDTPILAKKLRKKWEKTHPRKKSGLKWAKNGTKLKQLLKLKIGDKLAAAERKGIDLEYEEAIQQEMLETGKSRDLVIIGHSKVGSSKSRLHSKRGVEEGLNNSDITRLITAGVDLASIPVSYVPGGNAIAGFMGLGTMAADAWADFTDDSVSSGEMWGNLGMNAGLTGLSLIGGGLAKGSKAAKTIVKLLPVALATCGASELLLDKGFLKSFNKLKKGEYSKFTTNDLKNISAAIKIIAGGHNAAKSAAGSIGVDLATSKPAIFKNTTNKTGKVLSRWGNNDYIRSNKTARLQRLAELRPDRLTRTQRAHLQNQALLEEGGFQNPLSNVIKRGDKYILKTTNGEQEIESSVYKAMQNAYEKAAKTPNATQADVEAKVKKAYTDEMTRLGKLTSTEETVSSGKVNLTDEAAKTFFETIPEEGKAIELAIKEHGNGTTKLNLTAEQFNQLKLAYNERGLDGLNSKYTELFPNTTRTVAPNIPQFVIPEITSRGRWNPMRHLSRPNLGGEDLGSSWWGRHVFNGDINPVATETHNGNLIGRLRLFDRPNLTFASDVEYNNGLAGWFGSRHDYSTEMASYKHNQLMSRLLEKINDPSRRIKAQLLMLDRELSKTPELGSWSQDAINSHLSKYAQSKGLRDMSNALILREAKNQAINEGRSLLSVLRNPVRGSNLEANAPKLPTLTTLDMRKLILEHPEFEKLSHAERNLLFNSLESLKPALGLDKSASNADVIKAFLNKKGSDTISNTISKLIGENKTIKYLKFSKSDIAKDLFKELKGKNPSNTKADRMQLASEYQSVIKRANNLYKERINGDRLKTLNDAILNKFKSSGSVKLSISEIKNILGELPKGLGSPKTPKTPIVLGNAGNVTYTNLTFGYGKNKTSVPVLDLKSHIVPTKDGTREAYGAAYLHFKDYTLKNSKKLTPEEIKHYKKLFGKKLRSDIKNGWLTSSGKLIFEKQGGKLSQLQSLKSFNGEGTTSLKNGGIVKYQQPAQTIVPKQGISSNRNTWSSEVWRLLRSKLYNDLRTGKMSVNAFNNYLASHANSYRAASANGNDFYKIAYIPQTGSQDVAEQQRAYQGWGYNDIAIGPNEAARYHVYSDNPNSKDSKAGRWKDDNLYSGKHDDRRFGREGDWDENSAEFKQWQKDLSLIGLKYELDPEDHYYKLRPIRKELKPRSSITESISDNDNTEGNGSVTKPTTGNFEKYLENKRKKDKLFNNPWDIAQFIGALRINDKLNKLAKEKTTALQSHTPLHLNLKEKVGHQAALQAANNITSVGLRTARGMTDASTATATGLDSARIRSQAILQENLANDLFIQDQIDKITAQEFANVQQKDADKNENAMRLAQLYNTWKDYDMAKISSDFNDVIKPFLMERSADKKMKEADNINKNVKLAQLKAEVNSKNYFAGYLAAIDSAKTTDEKNKAIDAYAKALREYADNQGYQDQLDIYEAAGYDVSELRRKKKNSSYGFSNNGSGYVFRKKREGMLKTLKSGGSTSKDDGLVKTRTKDLDRFQKAVKHAADSHDKKLARLAAATLAELKRTMGK